ISESRRPVHSGTTCRNACLAPARERLDEREDVGCSIPLVLVIDPARTSRPSRNRLTGFLDELHRHFVHTHNGRGRIIRSLIDVKDIFHPSHILSIVIRWNHPSDMPVGIERVFLRAFRTVSWLTPSTPSRRTSSSANRCKVQHARPAGGLPWTSASNVRSFSSSNTGVLGGGSWRLRFNATSNPSITNCCRIL